MNNSTETKVYIFPADAEVTTDSSDEDIINYCEKTGEVYSLQGFAEGLNSEDIFLSDSFVRIIDTKETARNNEETTTESKSLHTKGEWKLGSQISGDEYAVNILGGQHNGVIANTNINPYFNYEQAEANAAHIVKCVNSHDELVELVRWISRATNSPEIGSKGNN